MPCLLTEVVGGKANVSPARSTNFDTEVNLKTSFYENVGKNENGID
jgi:hypothetical protein